MKAELAIIQGNRLFLPEVKEGAKLTWVRKGRPGELSFTILKDPALLPAEGDPVKLTLEGEGLFYGFIFKQQEDKSGELQITAYDQLRYLKNKDTFIGQGLKASQLLTRLAEDFRLNLGEVEDTGFVIDTIDEQNQTLFDMIQNALDETLKATGRLFVLYDRAGRLTLKDIRSMALDLVLDPQTGENFQLSSDMDRQTYSRVKLSYPDPDTGTRKIYQAQNGEALNRFGVLQYYEELRSPTGAAAKADALLKLYGGLSRSLSVKSAFGDPRVRAGSALMVSLGLSRLPRGFMVVEKVTHQFRKEGHFMDLDLIGGDFIG